MCRRMRRRRRCGRGWRIKIPAISFPKIFPRRVSDDRVEAIYELLPKRDCGACGYESCYECALAIVEGEAPPDACKIVGKRVAPQIRRILGR